jgi:hypothetical protein
MRMAECHPDRKYRALGLCNACYLKQNGGSKRWYRKNRKLIIKRATKRNIENAVPRSRTLRRDHRAVKIEVLTHYGKGGKLKCCWKNCRVIDIDMLSLDHINNDGAADRKEIGSGTRIYYSVKKNNFPEGLQTICHNHQWKKEIARRRKGRK